MTAGSVRDTTLAIHMGREHEDMLETGLPLEGQGSRQAREVGAAMMTDEPTCRIVQRERFVSGKMMAHSDVFIEWRGQTYYSRYWWVLSDTPHVRAAEIQGFKKRAETYHYA